MAAAHMPAPSAIPGNLAQVMHMIHWTLPRPRFKILFVLAAPCSKPVCPERDRRKAPSSAMSVNELAAFDRSPHKTTMPLDEMCIFGYHTASIPPQLAPRSPRHRKPCTSSPGLKALLLSIERLKVDDTDSSSRVLGKIFGLALHLSPPFPDQSVAPAETEGREGGRYQPALPTTRPGHHHDSFHNEPTHPSAAAAFAASGQIMGINCRKARNGRPPTPDDSLTSPNSSLLR